MAVHPRMRGENATDFKEKALEIAVHPRMRGENGVLVREEMVKNRSIPACAGKTPHRAPRSGRRAGPSPHARGKRTRSRSRTAPTRSIPACAGKTPRRADRGARASVHPRMRGENGAVTPGCSSSCGPSPHARGKPMEAGGCGMNERSIPACAGKTAVDRFATAVDSVHPRMRGENAQEGRPGAERARSIPACAGKT